MLAGLPPGEEPVVETTGEPAAIEAALQRAPDLGIVVIAGPMATAPAPLDLYSDLHVRGLTVLCVPPGDDAP